MDSHDKFTLLMFENIPGVIYDNDCITGVEYEDNEYKNKYYSEEYQEDESYTESENYESDDQNEDLEAEENIDEYELAY